jgi:hypothetical protein
MNNERSIIEITEYKDWIYLSAFIEDTRMKMKKLDNKLLISDQKKAFLHKFIHDNKEYGNNKYFDSHIIDNGKVVKSLKNLQQYINQI